MTWLSVGEKSVQYQELKASGKGQPQAPASYSLPFADYEQPKASVTLPRHQEELLEFP